MGVMASDHTIMNLQAPATAPHGLSEIPPDLTTPPVTDGAPAAGRRVRQVHPGFVKTGVYHALYLPEDWIPGRRYPMIVEYAGNQSGSSLGTVEGSNLGYGISGGKGIIWLCLPFVDTRKMENALHWWGDVAATVEYCKTTVQRVCFEYGGDPDAVILAGFSRGAIACNYIGLHDDAIAALWRGFICHSHYEAGQEWIPYPGNDRAGAPARLARLKGRPQFISHEKQVEPGTVEFLRSRCPDGKFTFFSLRYPEHTDTWVLRDVPERKVVRKWLQETVSHV